jgi:hypothetical protein
MPPWIDLRPPVVNPLGNPLGAYSSANWINLNGPSVLVDYTAFAPGTPLAAGTLPGGQADRHRVEGRERRADLAHDGAQHHRSRDRQHVVVRTH